MLLIWKEFFMHVILSFNTCRCAIITRLNVIYTKFRHAMIAQLNKIWCVWACACAIARHSWPGLHNNDTLDPSLFFHDKLHLIQKGNIKLSESIITVTEDRNISQNTHFNMSNKKHQFMKTFKMAVFFKLNHADFPPFLNSTVSKPVSYVSSSLSFATGSRSFSNKVRAISFKSLTKASNKPFPRATCFCPWKYSS